MVRQLYSLWAEGPAMGGENRCWNIHCPQESCHEALYKIKKTYTSEDHQEGSWCSIKEICHNPSLFLAATGVSLATPHSPVHLHTWLSSFKEQPSLSSLPDCQSFMPDCPALLPKTWCDHLSIFLSWSPRLSCQCPQFSPVELHQSAAIQISFLHRSATAISWTKIHFPLFNVCQWFCIPK